MKKRIPGKILAARIMTVAVFLALIRTIAEIYRLHAVSDPPWNYQTIAPYLLAALITAIALLLMTILNWTEKHVLIILLAALTIAALFVIKFTMH